jgi:predicted lipid-binding transport protein (Tim44 family)
MGSSSGFPIDIILFGMIAAFLVLRLRSILGRRQGFERPPEPRVVSPLDGRATGPVVDVGPAEPAAPAAPGRALPDPASPGGLGLASMGKVDPTFSADAFLHGAETAFRMIVAGFAAGDRATLRPLLSDDTFRAFEAAIAAREAAGETQRTEIRAIGAAAIETAELRGTTAAITVRFVSDQVNITVNREGQPVLGTDAVTEITDLWTFERDLTSADPTWKLVAARSA